MTNLNVSFSLEYSHPTVTKISQDMQTLLGRADKESLFWCEGTQGATAKLKVSSCALFHHPFTMPLYVLTSAPLSFPPI